MDDMADVLSSLGLDISPFLTNLGAAETAMATSLGNMQKLAAGFSLGGGFGGGGAGMQMPVPDYQPAIAAAEQLTGAESVLKDETEQVTNSFWEHISSLRAEAQAYNDLAGAIRMETSLKQMERSLGQSATPVTNVSAQQLSDLHDLTEARRSDAQAAVAAAELQQQAYKGLAETYVEQGAQMTAGERTEIQAQIQAEAARAAAATASAQEQVSDFKGAMADETAALRAAKQQQTSETRAAAQEQAQATRLLSGETSGLASQLNALGVPAGNVQRYFTQGAQALDLMGSAEEAAAGATLGLSAATIGLVAVALIAAQAILQMTQGYIAYADQIRNTALITGASQLEVQALTASLGAQGIASSQVVTALTLMDQRGQQLFDQMQTGQAVTGRMASALHELGISAVAFATANTDERINLIADALQRAGGDTQTTAAAVELLGGRFGRTLIPALEGGSAGIEHWRQATISANAAVEGAQQPVLQWHAAMTQLNLVWQGLTQEVGGVALPLLTVAVTIIRLFLDLISALLSPLRLVAAAIQGVEAGLGKLASAWDAVPGPIRTAVEETLKFVSPVTALPELANRATQAVTNLAEGHGIAGAAAEKHGQKERESAQQISEALALARGAYSDLAPEQSVILLDDAVAKLGKTQAGTALISQMLAAELAHAGQAATDEATLTSQMGAAALAAGIPISEVARVMQLLNGVAQENGTEFLRVAVAHAEAAQAALRDAAAHREFLGVLTSTTAQQGAFTTDLAKLGQTSGAAFSAAFGSAAGGMAQGLVDQANKADATFNALGAKLLADSATLEDLKKGKAEQSAIDAAQAQVDSDNLALASAQKTTAEKIAAAQGYVEAVRQAQGQIISLEQEAFQTQQQYAQLGVGAEADAARSLLAAEQGDISQLLALWQQYYTTTDALARASILSQIGDLTLRKQADAGFAADASRLAQERVAAEQQAADAIRSLNQSLFDLQHNYLQETVQGHNAGLDQIGQHEQSLIDDLKRLWIEYRNTTDEVQRGILLGQIHADEQLLSDVQQTFGQIAGIVQQVRDSELAAGHGVLSAQQTIFDAQERLTYLTADERSRGEDVYLQKVISVQGQILGLQQQLATETDPEKIFHIKDTINGLTLIADTATQAANQIRTGYQDAQKPNNSGLTDLRDQTVAQVDLNQAMADGYNLQRSGLELGKQVKDTSDLVTKSQVDGAHAATEAARARAQADFAAATAAQQHWLDVAATIDTTTGLSTKFSEQEVRQAESAAKTAGAAYHLSAQQFKDDLGDESALATRLEQQQSAAAAAQKTYADARRQDAAAALSAENALLDSYQKFTSTVASTAAAASAPILASQVAVRVAVDATGQHMVESAHTAAAGAQAAYEQANQRVLADQHALTAELAPEARKRLQAQLDADVAIRDGAQSTASALKTIYDRDAAAFESAEDKKVAAAKTARDAEESAADAWAKVADAAYTAYNDEVSNAISENGALVQNSISTQAAIISANTAANEASIKAKHETNAQLAQLDREQAGLERQLAAAELTLGQAKANQAIAQANLKRAEDEATVQSAINLAQAQATIAGRLAQQSATIASLTAQLMVALAVQSDQDIVKSAQSRTTDLVNLELAKFSAVQLTEPAIAQIQADADTARVATGTDRTTALKQLESDWVHAAVNAASIAFDAYAAAARAEGDDAADLAAKRLQFEDDWATAAQRAANVVIEATNKATGSKTKDIDVTGAQITDLLGKIGAAAVAIDTHIGDTSVHVSQSIQDAAHEADAAVNTATAHFGDLQNALAGLNEQRAAIDTTAGGDTGGSITANTGMPMGGGQQPSRSGIISAATSLADAETALADAQMALATATALSTRAYGDFSMAMSGSGSTVGTADAQYATFTSVLGRVSSGAGLAAQAVGKTGDAAKLAGDQITANADAAKAAADAYAAWTSELGVSAKVSLSAEERVRNLGRLLDDIRTSASMAQDAMDSLLGQSSTEELQQGASLADVNAQIADYNAMVANGGTANQPLLDALNKQQASIQANIDQLRAHRAALQAHVDAQNAAAGNTTLTMKQMEDAYAHFEGNAGILLQRVGGHWDDVIGDIKKGADEMQTAASSMVSALSSIASEMDKVASATQALAKANADLAQSYQDAQKQSQGGDGGGGGDLAILSSGMVPGRGSATSGGGQGLNANGFGMTSFAHGTAFVPEDMIAYIHKGETIIPADVPRTPEGGGLPSAYYELLRAAEAATARLSPAAPATAAAATNAGPIGGSTQISLGGVSVTVQGTANMTPREFERAVERGAEAALERAFGGRTATQHGVR